MAKNGLHLITPTTVNKTGASSTATISANGSVEFALCTSLSLNGVFSADYDNYQIVLRGTANDIDVWMRLRSSGVDASTSDYTAQQLAASSTTVSGARGTSLTRIDVGVFANGSVAGSVVWFYGPYLTQPTAVRSVNVNGISGAYLIDEAGTHSLSNSYDGFTILDNGLNDPMTGRVAVYGMRK